jgi:hypothetical protein
MTNVYDVYVKFWLKVEAGNPDEANEAIRYELTRLFGEEQDYEVSAKSLRVVA